MDFNPFDKRPSDLVPSDLLALSNVAEGWFVEYKRELQSAPKIAASVSALANSRGGWLCYGVVAPSASVGVPESFDGVPTSDTPALLRRLTDAVAAHVSPHPFFEAIVLNGPVPELKLREDRSVLIVQVPVGRRAPYVHSSGRIYVRVGDKSDPIVETDRSRIQHIFERTERITRDLRDLLDATPIEYGDRSLLKLFVSPDLWNDRRLTHTLDLRRFAELMGDPAPPETLGPDDDLFRHSFTMPFSRVHSSADWLVARQSGSATGTGVTLRLRRNGTIVVVIPIPYRDVADERAAAAFLDGYKHVDDFMASWSADGYRGTRILDLSLAYAVLVGMWRKVYRLMTVGELVTERSMVDVQMRLYNAKPAVSFIDTMDYAEHIRKYGLPITTESRVAVPGQEPEDMLSLSCDGEEGLTGFVNGTLLMFHLSGSLGMGFGVDDLTKENASRSVREFIELFRRADRVLKRRNVAER